MIASHRTPAVGLMTAGGFLFLVGLALPHIFSPGTPHGIAVASAVLIIASAPAFIAGACVYARGIGYPFWLGIFAVTLVGLLILMLLPDRRPGPDDTGSQAGTMQ
jgi:hypothetical protein